MNAIICPACKTEIDSRNSKQTYNSEKKYSLYHCLTCDLEFWSPLEMPDGKWYEINPNQDYIHKKRVGEVAPHLAHFFKHFPLSKGRLLEVGCGDGLFLEFAQKEGFEVWGVDFDRKAVEVAKRRGLKNVFSISFNDFVEYAKKEMLKFDAITFFECLEHQEDPDEFIKNIKTLLKCGGRIAGSVPNRDRLIINRDVWDWPPHHLIWWNKKSVEKFLAKSFKEVLIYEVYYPYQMRNASNRFIPKDNIKSLALKDSNLAKELAIKDLKKMNEINPLTIKILKTMKNVKDSLLFPPMESLEFFIIKTLKKPVHLYFQGKV